MPAVSPSTVTSSGSNHRPTSRPHAEYRQRVERNAAEADARRAGGSGHGHVDASRDAGADAEQRLTLFAPGFVHLDRGRPGATVGLVHFLDPDQLLGVRERQRPQDDRVQNAEDGARGADAERESQHRRQREAGALPQQPHAPAEIDAEVCEPRPHAAPAADLIVMDTAAEVAEHAATGGWPMKYAVWFVRLIFAAWMIPAGLNHFVTLFPQPLGTQPLSQELFLALFDSHLFDLVKLVELVAGIGVLFGF